MCSVLNGDVVSNTFIAKSGLWNLQIHHGALGKSCRCGGHFKHCICRYTSTPKFVIDSKQSATCCVPDELKTLHVRHMIHDCKHADFSPFQIRLLNIAYPLSRFACEVSIACVARCPSTEQKYGGVQPGRCGCFDSNRRRSRYRRSFTSRQKESKKDFK